MDQALEAIEISVLSRLRWQKMMDSSKLNQDPSQSSEIALLKMSRTLIWQRRRQGCPVEAPFIFQRTCGMACTSANSANQHWNSCQEWKFRRVRRNCHRSPWIWSHTQSDLKRRSSHKFPKARSTYREQSVSLNASSVIKITSKRCTMRIREKRIPSTLDLRK